MRPSFKIVHDVRNTMRNFCFVCEDMAREEKEENASLKDVRKFIKFDI